MMILRFIRLWLVLLFVVAGFCVEGAEPPESPESPETPEPPATVSKEFLGKYCYGCHGEEKQKGDVRLDTAGRDLGDSNTAFLWEGVLDQIEFGDMPPKKAEVHPSEEEVEAVVEKLGGMLGAARAEAEVGGTVLRRLNRVEYEQSVRELFGIDFAAPLSFPVDGSYHGFDNHGEGLVLSPPLMQQYFEIATLVADQVIPPAGDEGVGVARTVEISPGDMSISFSSGTVVDGAMRLVSKSDPIARSCSWPIRFEAKEAGFYRVNLSLSKFKPWDDEAMVLELRARDTQGFGNIQDHRMLGEFGVDSEEATKFSVNVELYENETLVFYYRNAPLDSDNNREDKEALEQIVMDLFERDPGLHAAWLKKGFPRGFRGEGSWKQLQAIKGEADLDLSTADLESKETAALMKLILRNTVATLEAIAWGHFEEGPGLDIHGVEVIGPMDLGDEVLEMTGEVGGYEAKVSGRYVVEVDGVELEAGMVYEVDVYAMDGDSELEKKEGWRLLTQFEMGADFQERYAAEVEVYRGERVVFVWSDSGKRQIWLRDKIEGGRVRGPVGLVENEAMRKQRKVTAGFMGERDGLGDDEYAEAILRPFLSRAFRRPVSDEGVGEYVDLAMGHLGEGYRFEDGLHLAIRTALTSPRFLYRGFKEGRLDDYDLAARLSYFLWNGPPDEKLLGLAGEGKLSDAKVLGGEARRLLKSFKSKRFVESFTGQWLGTRKLEQIMPDERLLKFVESDRAAMIDETEMFFAEILGKDLPLETFVDPDFTFLNDRLVKNIYKLKGVKVGGKMERVGIEKGGRMGGILGQATVMMATANGVDTQPILRGVWLLENVLGDPPPTPPQNVPAIEPDTTGATSIRELLEVHRSDESCAGCHKKIDPLGLALENFDPVGRWRTHYPIYVVNGSGKSVTTKGDAVDASGQMPDGAKFEDVVDLKAYMIENVDQFAKCLAEKLMIYATGRTMSYGDHRVIEEVVGEVKGRGNGFADLVVSLVLSEVFAVK